MNFKKEITQVEIVIEFFKNYPLKDIPHPQVVDCVTAEYQKRTGKVFRDPDRQIRKLHQEGFLIKVAKGIYKYDPNFVQIRELEDFSQEQKKEKNNEDKNKKSIFKKFFFSFWFIISIIFIVWLVVGIVQYFLGLAYET